MHDEDGLSFFRGLLYAIPLSVMGWLAIWLLMSFSQ